MTKKNKKLSAVQLGKRIKKLRIEKKLTQAKLGEIVGTYSSHVGKWERGESAPDHEYAIKIESVLGPLTAPDASLEVSKPPISLIQVEPEESLDDFLKDAKEILLSGTIYSKALRQNIRAFHCAHLLEKGASQHQMTEEKDHQIRMPEERIQGE